ncbi:MAG: hypothetical protein KDH19_06925 [Geminicoccaceae bacterium]|nr:hypothetical protein [Geminicoccaceae bacterium]
MTATLLKWTEADARGLPLLLEAMGDGRQGSTFRRYRVDSVPGLLVTHEFRPDVGQIIHTVSITKAGRTSVHSFKDHAGLAAILNRCGVERP